METFPFSLTTSSTSNPSQPQNILFLLWPSPFMAAARRATVVIMTRSLSVYHSLCESCHFNRCWKYHRHWGRGRWAPQRQNIIETIHVNGNKVNRKRLNWAVPHSEPNKKQKKCPPRNLHTAAVYVASCNFLSTQWVDQICFSQHQNPSWNTWDKNFECGTAQPS